MQSDSDLKVIPLVLALIVAVLVILAAFFFVGAAAGIAVLLVAVVLGLLALARFIRRNDLS